MSKLRIFVTIVLVASLWGAVEAAQLVVIASTASNLKLGAIIDGAKTLTLPQGSSVTLISPEGRTIKLKGPYKGQPDPSRSAKTNDLLQSLSRIVTGPPENDPSLTVFRAAPGAVRPDVWSINVGRSGVYCVRTDTPVNLWRANASKKTVLTLKRAGGQGDNTNKEWPQGKQKLVWPTDLPLTDRSTYLARVKGGYKWARLQIVLLPKELPTDAHRAVWLAEHDCARQARRLVDAIV
ncbi:MAG: hypothetical protein V3V96_10975 [Acidiferrobacterales bacterium]